MSSVHALIRDEVATFISLHCLSARRVKRVVVRQASASASEWDAVDSPPLANRLLAKASPPRLQKRLLSVDHAVSSERQHRRTRSSAKSSTSRTELYILGAGLAAAVASGVIAYQIVGPYGDGPFGGGFRRISNPETGRSTLIHDFVYESERVRAVVNENTGRLSEFRLDSDGDGTQDTRAHLDLEGTAGGPC